MRGLFTAGVIDVMMQNDVLYDGMIGVSAGAAFGCNYKSGQMGRTLRYNKKYCRDKRYCSLRSLILTGDMYGAEFCYRTIPMELDLFDDEAYKKNPMEFYLVCTDIETGKPLYRKMESLAGDNADWIRASASLPMAARIVELEGLKLLDGGITDSIPIKYFKSIGYDKNVVVLTQPRGYLKKKNKLIPVIKRKYGKYPNLITALEKRHEMYNETLSYIQELENKGEIFVIRPEADLPVNHVSHDPQKLQQTYDMGKKTMEKNIEKLKSFFNSDF